MSGTVHRRRAAAIVAGFALVALPAAAEAAPVDLATAGPFVVLGGQSVTNTGPSVLNGDLGVAPGTSLVGFALPATVNGATHANNAVAAKAQNDLTTAYTVAAGQPVAPADVLTGTNLGNRTLKRGNYRYATSAQLTGALTLDAEGDPNAQFVFEIGSTLTTAGASSVVLINGASPCNVYWQVGSSATLGTTTAFQGNILALTSATLNNGASVRGRVLARNGSITLNNNVLDNSMCRAGATPSPTGTPTTGQPATGGGTQPGTTGPGGTPAGGDGGPSGSPSGAVTRDGTAIITRGRPTSCDEGFRVGVRGRNIKAVVFRLDGKRVATLKKSPWKVLIKATAGRHKVTAKVTFTDATRTKAVSMKYRACAAAALNPRNGPSAYTG